jgi:hypothetical protein
VLGRDVPQVHLPVLHPVPVLAEDALGVQTDIQPDDVVAGGAQPRDEDTAQVTLVAGDEYAHVDSW